MQKKEDERAKEIYFQYYGSKFQMMRDGISEEYIKYNISTNKEIEWLKELIEINFSRLDINDKESLFPLWYIIITNCESSYIDKIIDFVFLNKNNASTKETLLAFISKVEEIIDRLDDACKHIPLTTSRYKSRILLFKEKERL